MRYQGIDVKCMFTCRKLDQQLQRVSLTHNIITCHVIIHSVASMSNENSHLALQVPGPHAHHVAALLRAWQPVQRLEHCMAPATHHIGHRMN